MKPNQILLLVLVVGLLAVLGVDLVLYMKNGLDGTLSQAIWDLLHNWPIVGLLTGVLLGHCFFPGRLAGDEWTCEYCGRRNSRKV